MQDQYTGTVPTLYTFACAHRADQILDTGVVMSARLLATPSQRRGLEHADTAVRMAAQVSWFTTLEEVTNTHAVPDATCGLVDVMCNHFEYRFRVQPDNQQIEPWVRMRTIWPKDAVDTLEGLTGAQSTTWWIAGAPIKVVLASIPLKSSSC